MTISTKRSSVFVAVTALACVTALETLSVQAKERGIRAAFSENSAERLFNRLDTSEDGLLQLDELTTPAVERAERRFTRKDTDESGTITFEEATANRTPEDLTEFAEDIVLCVEEAALENDLIQVPDVDKFTSPEEKFAAVDLSGDELIDLEEAQTNAINKATTAFEQMDADESGDVTLDEYTAQREVRSATKSAVRECISEVVDEMI